MSITNFGLLKRDHFAGHGKVFGVGADCLVSQMRATLEKAAEERFALRNLLNMVDGGGGLAGMTFTSANATEISTCTLPVEGHGFKTGDGPFRLSSATNDLPSGLAELTDYWVTRLSATTFYICASKAAALSGKVTDAVALADDGTGTHKILAISSVSLPVETNLSGGTLGFTIASWDTSVDSVSDALAVVMDQANQLLEVIGDGGIGDPEFTVTTRGTIPTVDIDVADNTVDTDATNMVSCRAALAEMDAELRDCILAVSRVRVAVGLGEVPEGSLTRKVAADDGWNLNGSAANTNGVVTDATTILTAPLQTAVEISLSSYRDNISLLAVLLDEVTKLEAVIRIPVVQIIPQTEYAAGTSVWVTAPVSGRIRLIESIVVDEIAAGAGAITLEIGGSAVSGASLVVADGAIIGEYDLDAVTDTQVAGPPKVATGNYVNKGDLIELVGDATPTAGALQVTIWIEPTGEDLVANPILAAFAG